MMRLWPLVIGLTVTLTASLTAPEMTFSADFPGDFKWCVATSAHQIEGGNIYSDWWHFEQVPGSIADGNPSGDAADHWNRLEEDVGLLERLHVRQYRFSVEWAKIQPAPDQWSQEALQHYKREIALLRERRIEPLITLQHFTLPQWVAERGGFEWSGMSDAFGAYSEKVFHELGDGVSDWVTINEPQVILAAGYVEGVFPPKKTGLKNVARPAVGLIRAHAQAYHRLHRLAAQRGQNIRVGMAHHLRVFDPAERWNPLDRWASAILDRVGNWSIPLALQTGRLAISIPLTLDVQVSIPEARDTQDFFGVNYYSRDSISFSPSAPGFIKRQVKNRRPVSDLGWEIYPQGFYRVLKSISKHQPDLPVLVTENGTADSRDAFRSDFLVDHLRWLKRALDEGVRVENYCHWSLLDNYEWAEGFKPRFGLYHVDYGTQARTLRNSGALFSEIARTNMLPPLER